MLKSIESQTYSNIEVIVADYMSSDTTEQIARKLCESSSHILLNRKLVVLISARAVKKTGTFSYIVQTGLGKSISYFEQLKTSKP